MYRYTIKPMPGQKAKFEGDTSVKYRVIRHNTDVVSKHKTLTDIIKTNLDYDEAMAIIKIFNDKEQGTQLRRDERAERKNAS
jgi:hypothetical protein